MMAVSTAKRVRGLTLIEMLISMTVALVVSLAVYQSFAASEGYRRAATSGGDAGFSGSIGMHTLQRDLRMAGYGINSTGLLGCRVLAYDEGVSPPRDFNFTLAPVVVTQGVGGAPDTIEISYSSTDSVPVPIRLTQALTSPTAEYHADNTFSLEAGQLIVVGEPGQDCILQQITNTPSQEAPGRRDVIAHVDGTYRTPTGATAATRYNKTGGIGPNYTLNGLIYPIGRTPTVVRYSIQNENLVADAMLQGVTAFPVAANIVQLQAQYGRDTNNDGAVDVWDETAPATANDWAGVIAVRLGLVARSATAERPDVNGNCNTTTVMPAWSAGTFDLSARQDWRCYHYRVFEATVTLRNMIWRPA